MTKEQPQPRSAGRNRVQSAEMGMSILKALARFDGVASLTAVATEVGENTAKVHRYMASLIQEGLVAQDSSTQRYYLASEAIHIGLAALRQCNPLRLGEQSLARLREELEVTCFLAIMGNKGPTILRFEEPGLPVTINVRVGSVLPLLWSATGRVFLSYMDETGIRIQAEEELDEATEEQRSSLQPNDPIGAMREAVRKRGSAMIKDTLLKGISAVAAPIFDHTGRVSAVLTALGAASAFDTSPEGAVSVAVVREAGNISATLGYSSPAARNAT